MERYVLGFWLAGWGALHLWHGNTDQHQRVLESGIFGALTFCPCLDISSITPVKLALELTGCCARALEFGIAECECRILNLQRHFLHCPLELALELTDCCVRVLTTSASQRVSTCVLNLP